jgi:hypothetical protein
MPSPEGDNLNSPNAINPLPICDVYLVTGIDEDGHKVKTTLEQICINDEDMRPTEQYGPTFIKRNNSRLYQAQMFRICINSIKENAWVRDYSVDLEQAHQLHLNTFAHSKVKGFICGAAMCSQQVLGLKAKMLARHVIAGKQKTSGT